MIAYVPVGFFPPTHPNITTDQQMCMIVIKLSSLVVVSFQSSENRSFTVFLSIHLSW